MTSDSKYTGNSNEKFERLHSERENTTAVATVESLLVRRTSLGDANRDERGLTNRVDPPVPDGGWRAWLVCLAAFWVNGTLFGVINSAGVFYVKLCEKYGGNDESSLKTSLVGSLCLGTTFLLSPIASILTDRYGARVTACAGSILVVTGMLLSSFVHSLDALYTLSVVVGLGASLTYTPSLVVLGFHFRRRLGLVNGIVSAGSSLFTVVMPLLLRVMLDELQLAVTYQILAAFMATLLACALLFQPPAIYSDGNLAALAAATLDRQSGSRTSCSRCCHQLVNTSIWRNRTYMIWAFAFPTCLFGYFVPYVHLVNHVKDTLPDKSGELLITCIGAASGLGRIVAGQIADTPNVSRILLQQVSLICVGVFTMLLAASSEYWVLIAISAGVGIFDGCFICLLAPIAFDLVGQTGASQAIGFLLGLCSIPLTLGPPIAGWMYDHMGQDYKMAFIAAGVPPIAGALLMFLTKCVKLPNVRCKEESIQRENISTSITNETKLSDALFQSESTNDVWQLRPEFVHQALVQIGSRDSLAITPVTEKLGSHSIDSKLSKSRHASVSSKAADQNIIYVEKHSTC